MTSCVEPAAHAVDESVIADLRRRIHALEAENAVLKVSRDTYMQKVADMQQQVNYWRHRVAKVRP